MRRYAVIGWPVGHSLSPAMQNAAFKACGIDALYEAVPIEPEEFHTGIRRLLDEGFDGWNVTVPHKERMFEACDALGNGDARASGTVNTVVVSNGRMTGYSTDALGVVRAIAHDFGIRSMPATQLYLGCGGAAQAVATHAAVNGSRTLYLANRTIEKAEAQVRRISALNPACRAIAIPLAAAPEVVPKCDIVFQCTSLGMRPDDPMPIPPEAIPVDTPVFDFVYTPSRFREALRLRGNPVSDGLEMLLQQGMESFRIWTGLDAPEEEMRSALHA